MQTADTEQSSQPLKRRHKSAILLVTLVLSILVAPLGQLFNEGKLLDMILATVVIGASLNAISHKKRSTVFWAVGMASFALISGWLHVRFEGNIHLILSHSFGAVLYAYMGSLLFKVILLEDEITIDQIFAAVAIYIFIGLTWAHFYALTEAFYAHSFIVNDNTDPNFIYFSFVTLTTLGYGDMLPITAFAKALTIIQSITGVMFVAVLVATLVSRVNMKR